jgi:thymidine kinase
MNYNKNMGKLEIIMGTMFSGKTSYLLNKIALFVELNLKVLYLNIDFDDRSELEFSTHNPIFNSIDFKKKDKINENLTMTKVRDFSNIIFESYDIIMIDEAHFFDDIIKFTKKLIDNKKHVIIATLIADYKGNKFGKVLDLIPICDEVVRLESYCIECSKQKKINKAIYSKRITKNKESIDIGGSDKYVAVCREHYVN